MKKVLDDFIAMSDEALSDAYSSLSNWKPHSEQYSAIAENIKVLANEHLKAIEIGLKTEQEDKKLELEERKRDIELDNQITQLENEIKNQTMQLLVGAGLQLIGIINYDAVYFSGLNFEKTGTPCSKFFSTVIQRSSDLLKLKK